jgi:hypothetical protein
MEKKNKPLSEKWKTAQANGDNILSHMFYSADVKQAVKEAYDYINQSVHFDKRQKSFINIVFEDKFGFDMSKEKLKTLKEIAQLEKYWHPEKQGFCDELRAEAVKWVKDIEGGAIDGTTYMHFFKLFFNLTEEDLE